MLFFTKSIISIAYYYKYDILNIIYFNFGEIDMKNYLKIILSLLLIISITVSSLGGFSVNAATEQLANNFDPSKSFIRIENNDSIRYLGSTGNAEIADEDFPNS